MPLAGGAPGSLLARVRYVSHGILGRWVACQRIDTQTHATLGRRGSYGGVVAHHLGKFASALDYCFALRSVPTSAQYPVNTSTMPSCILRRVARTLPTVLKFWVFHPSGFEG